MKISIELTHTVELSQDDMDKALNFIANDFKAEDYNYHTAESAILKALDHVLGNGDIDIEKLNILSTDYFRNIDFSDDEQKTGEEIVEEYNSRSKNKIVNDFINENYDDEDEEEY